MINWIDRIKDLNIMVIGDLMIDRYITGRVNRDSPEAPVKVLSYQETKMCLGGAGNVALNLSQLGANVALCGVIGQDAEGEQIRKLCSEEEINTDLVVVDSARNTTLKTRYMAGEQHLLRVDREIDIQIPKSLSGRIFEYIEHYTNSKPIDLLIFQDYDKGVLDELLIKQLITLCQGHGIRTAADPKRRNFWHYENVDLFKPNLNEASFALKREIKETPADLKLALSEIYEKLKNRYTMITLGSNGLIISDSNDTHMEAGIKVKVSDVCGAGDTVISIAATGMASHLGLEGIALWSNKAAAWACTKPGVVAMTASQLAGLDQKVAFS